MPTNWLRSYSVIASRSRNAPISGQAVRDAARPNSPSFPHSKAFASGQKFRNKCVYRRGANDISVRQQAIRNSQFAIITPRMNAFA